MASVHDILEQVLARAARGLGRPRAIHVLIALALLAAVFSYRGQTTDEPAKPVPEQLRQRTITGPEEYPEPEGIRLVDNQRAAPAIAAI